VRPLPRNDLRIRVDGIFAGRCAIAGSATDPALPWVLNFPYENSHQEQKL
jgi:hypothetical protein